MFLLIKNDHRLQNKKGCTNLRSRSRRNTGFPPRITSSDLAYKRPLFPPSRPDKSRNTRCNHQQSTKLIHHAIIATIATVSTKSNFKSVIILDKEYLSLRHVSAATVSQHSVHYFRSLLDSYSYGPRRLVGAYG